MSKIDAANSPKPCHHGRTLITFALILCFVSVYNAYSQDYGGFTDPKTPGRHSRMNIDSAIIEVIPHGIYAEVRTEFWYRSVDIKTSNDTLELYALLNLPPTDFMNDSWLWVEDTLVRAMIIDVQTATLIYEEIVHRLHKDPSILYRRNTSGLYEYRIYPNIGHKSRHAKFSFYTKMNYNNGYAQFTFKPTILGLSTEKDFPRTYKFYFNDHFTDLDLSSIPATSFYSSDSIGRFVEYKTNHPISQQTFSYHYDFSKPYFSISPRIDDQVYYFTIFDSKLLYSNYISQKINFLIDYDVNRTFVSTKDVIEQLKKVIIANLNEKDSINIMIGGKNTINLFDRWVPCHKDTINALLDSNIYTKIGLYSYLYDLMIDGIKFNAMHKGNSSIVLLTSSEYAPTPAAANPIILECLKIMEPDLYRVTTIDFSDIYYSKYRINSKDYFGNQYFNEKIAGMTNGEYYTVKGSPKTIYSMLNSAFSNLKGSISDIGVYVEPKDGITIAKTSENLIDANSNTKLVYEFGKIEGSYPIDVKLSALLDGKPVIQKYQFFSDSAIISDESAKMWNWKYLRFLEDKKDKTKKESYDLVKRSISNRVLTTQTAFLCLEPWMMRRYESEEDPITSVIEKWDEIGLEVSYGPNPVESDLQIELKITDDKTIISSIGIYDLMGNLIKEFNFNLFSKQISLHWDAMSAHGKTPAGIYYLVIKTNLGSQVLKLTII